MMMTTKVTIPLRVVLVPLAPKPETKRNLVVEETLRAINHVLVRNNDHKGEMMVMKKKKQKQKKMTRKLQWKKSNHSSLNHAHPAPRGNTLLHRFNHPLHNNNNNNNTNPFLALVQQQWQLVQYRLYPLHRILLHLHPPPPRE